MTADATTEAATAERRRLFLAILPTDEARGALSARQHLLAPHLERPRPTARGNLHLTLAFLGMCDAQQQAAATQALAEAAALAQPFSLALGDLGVFCHKRGKSAVVWCGVAEDEGARELRALQARLEAALRARGLTLDGRPYQPHMTLFRQARLQGGRESAGQAFAGQAFADAQTRAPACAFPVNAASLMWSHHRESGGPLVYDEIARAPLGTPARRASGQLDR